MTNRNMVQGIYTIKDSKAESAVPPFVFRTDGEAIRAFDDSVNNEKTPMYNHPEDFALFLIGFFDPVSGVIEACEHKSLGCALDFKKGE